MGKLIIIIPKPFNYSVCLIFLTQKRWNIFPILVIVVIVKNLYYKLDILLNFSQCKSN